MALLADKNLPYVLPMDSRHTSSLVQVISCSLVSNLVIACKELRRVFVFILPLVMGIESAFFDSQNCKYCYWS